MVPRLRLRSPRGDSRDSGARLGRATATPRQVKHRCASQRRPVRERHISQARLGERLANTWLGSRRNRRVARVAPIARVHWTFMPLAVRRYLRLPALFSLDKAEVIDYRRGLGFYRVRRALEKGVSPFGPTPFIGLVRRMCQTSALELHPARHRTHRLSLALQVAVETPRVGFYFVATRRFRPGRASHREPQLALGARQCAPHCRLVVWLIRLAIV